MLISSNPPPAANVINGTPDDDTLSGTSKKDFIWGLGGDDLLSGGLGGDRLAGGDGNDHIMGSDDPADGPDSIYGGAGDDLIDGYRQSFGLIHGGPGQDTIHAGVSGGDNIHGGSGDDLIDAIPIFGELRGDTGDDHLLGFYVDSTFGGKLINTLDGGAGDDLLETTGEGTDSGVEYWLLLGGGGRDELRIQANGSGTLDGGDGADILVAGEASDAILIGGEGRDRLQGGGLHSWLEGGAGADLLIGGADADTFAFSAVSDSSLGARDTIQGLHPDDRIDLSAIDADETTAGDQAFVRVDKFDGHAGELRLTYHAATDVTVLEADVDGDGGADLKINIDGHHKDFGGLVL